MQIKVLHPNNLACAISRVDGFSSPVTLCNARITADEHCRIYLKPFLDEHSRGLANEITFWLYNAAVGVPQPREAFVVLAEPGFLAAKWPEIAWPTDRLIRCFATVALPSVSPKQFVRNERSRLLQQELLQWPDLLRCLVVHEVLHNSDGNLQGFLRLGPARYASLDGGNIMGGMQWTPESLACLQYVSNKLMYLAFRNRPSQQTLEQMIKCGEDFSLRLHQVMAEMFHWWWLLGGDPHVALAARTFVEKRSSQDWIAQRFGEWHGRRRHG